MIDLLGFAHTRFARGLGADIESLMARVAGVANDKSVLERLS